MRKKMFKAKKLILLGACCLMISSTTTGCIKPYNKPKLKTISASQTAFLVPLVGNSEKQASFESEDLLDKAKVPTKQVKIPRRWLKTGRFYWVGKYIDSAKLIVVERKPVTREWTSDKESGTSNKNQIISAESSESISFSVPMACSAQIDETNATKFLYRYNNKNLADVMDTEIRTMVESEFNKKCSAMTMDQIIKGKSSIMDSVVEKVDNFFTDRGITITVLGLKGEITYADQDIQKAINEKFTSEQKLTTQNNNNKVVISKAKAEAQAKQIEAEAEAKANKKIAQSINDKLIDIKIAEARKDHGWVTVQGSDSVIVDDRQDK